MKNIRTNLLLLLFTFIIIQSCIDEDYFGLSNASNITRIEVSNQASPAVINSNENEVLIEFPAGIDLTQIELQLLELSSFATSDKLPGAILDFTSSVNITVTAEDGSISEWLILPTTASENPQLQNSEFNDWYLTGAGYSEPGISEETTIWGTGNPGTQLLNIYATTPLELSDGDYAARMETLYNGGLPSSLGFPISAGTIYTGSFNSDNLDPSDPRAAIDFGTQFSGRPNSFSVDYSYIPGEENNDKKGDPLPYGDQCDIYVLLEVRSTGSVKRLATAWFRSGDLQSDLTRVEIEFVYGKLDESYPDYMKPLNNEYVSSDSAAFILPTHLTFVGTSSFEGDLFNGAIGSVLLLDNFALNYDD